MGTTALWQSTDQTSAYAATGAGSRRRVREFRVSSDTFAELRIGEAVVHTTLGPPPALCRVLEAKLHTTGPLLRLGSGAQTSCEIEVHAAKELPRPPRSKTARTARAAAPAPTPATTPAPAPTAPLADASASAALAAAKPVRPHRPPGAATIAPPAASQRLGSSDDV